LQKIRFEELDISSDVLRAIEDMGFEETTPIQTKAIPSIMQGKDIIGQAQTGTGKTVAFGIPILEKIDSFNNNTQAIILCPTRELAIQVSEELKRLAKFKRNITTLPVYGGQSISKQIKALKKGVQVVIGTPGRVMDHMRRGTLNLSSIEFLILDEADVMLDMGFIDDIETILRDIPDNKNTLFFSATIPKSIKKLSRKYQKNSMFVKVAHEKLTVPTTEQYYLEIKKGNKLKVLSRLIDLYNPELGLVFCNTRKEVDRVNMQLQARGYSSDAIHGGLNQNQRDHVMNNFKSGFTEILVATNVAARGIDIEGIEIVFNYDVPFDTDYYVHRIGRTGRAGKSGIAFTFIVGKDIYKLKDIQKYIKKSISRKNVPTRDDIEQARFEKVEIELMEYIDRKHLGKYINYIENLIDNKYTAIEIAAALLKKTIEKQAEIENSSEEANLGDTGAEAGMVRLFINKGKRDNISPKHIVGAISGETSLSGDLIGVIDIYEDFTFVEVPKRNGHEVLNIMKNNQIRGNKINIELAKPIVN